VIVVDATVVAHLLLGGRCEPEARALFVRDPDWVAPRVWRTAFRELLVVYRHRRGLAVTDALQLAADAERVLRGADYEVELARVLAVAERTGRCAMDCEHLALARELGVPYVTADRDLAAAMGHGAVWLGDMRA
jgi:predicted nucleic acid-binding protein